MYSVNLLIYIFQVKFFHLLTKYSVLINKIIFLSLRRKVNTISLSHNSGFVTTVSDSLQKQSQNQLRP